MSDSSQHIPGIYNWCDRWCERCAFVQRCAVGSQETADAENTESELFERLAESLEETRKLILTIAEERGISMEISPEEDEAYQQKVQNRNDIIKNHVAAQLSMSYTLKVRQWLQSDPLANKSNEARQKLQLGLQSEGESVEEALSINECLEVIQWYQHFITVKTRRALMEWADDEQKERPNSERNYNGTAKIALIAIQRSITAWGLLLSTLPEDEDQILEFLALLQKTESQLKSQFPNTEDFIRPGFDE